MGKLDSRKTRHRVAAAAVLLAANGIAAPAYSESQGAPQGADAAVATPVPSAPDRAVEILDSALPPADKVQALARLAEGHPAEGAVWTAYGEALLEAGDDDGASEAFERAVARDPEIFTAWHWLGVLHKRDRGNTESLGRALVAFERSLEAGAPRSRALNEIAVTHALLGDMDRALDVWEQAIAADPGWGVLYANAIKAALALGEEGKARAFFEQSLGAERFEPTAALQWGADRERRGRTGEAMGIYRAALNRAPREPAIRYAYALMLAESGDEERAARELRNAQMLAEESGDEPTGAAARLNLFALQHPRDHKRMMKAEDLVREAMGDPRRAGRNLRRVERELAPVIGSHPSIWEARLLRGIIRRQAGENQAAADDFLAVLEQHPEQPNALINTALVRRDAGDLDAAVEFAARAVESAAGDPFLRINAAFVYLDAGRCDEARAIHEALRPLFRTDDETPSGGDDPLEALWLEIEARCPQP